MKKAAVLLLAVFLISGCSGQDKQMERALTLRTKLLQASGCAFDADITADYGDKIQSFSINCTADSKGTVQFQLEKPESIRGITGSVDGRDGRLTFDDTVLTFPLLADNQVTPVIAPWIFLKTLRSGYLTAVGLEGELLRVSIDDSYDDDALRLDIWLDGKDQPVRAEALFRGRRILSLDVKNFRME